MALGGTAGLELAQRLPPGPDARGTVLFNLRFLREPDEALVRLNAEYGPISRVQLGPRPTVLMVGSDALRFLATSGPHDLQAGPAWRSVLPFYRGSLLATDGEEHRRQRSLLHPSFRLERIADYVPSMVDVVRRTAARWGTHIDLAEEMKGIALEIAARVLAGSSLEEDRLPFLRHSAVMADMILSLPGNVLPFSRRWHGARAKRWVWAMLRRLVSERRRHPGRDALSELVRAHDEGGGNLDEDRLLAHGFTLLAAGYETSAAFLTFALAVLSARPDLRERLLGEHERRVKGRPLENVTLSSLPFTRDFLREVERLYPPTPYIARLAMRDLEFAGYLLPRGTTLLGGLRLTHVLPEHFVNPFDFDPDRFAPPREEHRTPFALAGFGGGSHTCLGVHFALIEAMVVLHVLLPCFSIDLPDVGRLPEVRYHPFGMPAHPMIARVTRRMSHVTATIGRELAGAGWAGLRALFGSTLRLDFAGDVGGSSARFRQLTDRVRRVETRRELAGLLLRCVSAHGNDRAGSEPPLVTTLGTLRAGARSVWRFGVLTNPETWTVTRRFFGPRSSRFRLKTAVVFLAYDSLKGSLRRHGITRSLEPRSIEDAAEFVEGLYEVDDLVDDLGLLCSIRQSDSPVDHVHEFIDGLEPRRRLQRMLEERRWPSVEHQELVFELVAELWQNVVASLLRLSELRHETPAFAADVVAGITGVMAKAVLALLLSDMLEAHAPPDQSTLESAGTAVREVGAFAACMQCVDDFVDCVADGAVYGGLTGPNVFRCLVGMGGPGRLGELDRESGFDAVRVARAFPDELVELFLAVGRASPRGRLHDALRDALILQQIKRAM